MLYVSNKTLYNKYSDTYKLGKLICDLDELLKEIKGR